MEVIASEFARMAGVSAMAVSKRVKSGTLIRNSANKLDTDNPVNRAYLERMQAKIKTKLKSRAINTAVINSGVPDTVATRKRISNTASANSLDTAQVAGEMLNMTVRQLVERHGTIDNVEKYSKILSNLTVADERAQRTQEKRMLQIPKDFVVQRIFGYVDQLMNQLLDVPEAVCDQVIAVSLAGGDGVRVSVMHILSDSLTKCISGAKEHITGELNALKGKYDKQADMVQELVSQEIERMSEEG